MAAHAYAMHDIDRIAVLDFDLHHGDGTQAIVWRINAETVQRDASRKAQIDALMSERHSKPRHVKGAAAAVVPPVTEPLAEIEAKIGKRGLKMFYGSLHDIESFPCELGDKDKVYDASVCIEGAHGQWIWNVHLDSHAGSPTAVQNAYEQKYAQLLQKARRFFEQTESVAQRSLLIISAGFDACVHEHAGMQRHGKSVPTSFYTRFTRDVLALADSFAQGKCVSVLEGGYSDRALTSGVAAHLVGLAGLSDQQSNDICQSTTLAQLERIGKLSAASMIAVDAVANATGNAFGEPTAQHLQRKRQELGPRDPEWLKHALEAFKRLQEHCGSTRAPPIPTFTSPSTPFGEELWRTPRKTRSMRNLAQSAKASPMK
jgi:histone deacetylase HOS3